MKNRTKKENCVKGEIHNILAIIRFVPTFTLSPENANLAQHLAEFKELFQNLHLQSDVDSIDFCSPFLKIIQTSDLSNPLTGVTLSSIHKFLLYGFVSPSSGYSLNKIVHSVVQCRFPRVYTSNDEVVMMKLLHVFLECLKTPAGIYLTDDSVWSIVRRCFDVFEKEKVSELLRRTVQNVLLQIFLIIFGRINEIGHEPGTYGIPCIRNILLHLAELIGHNDKSDPFYKEKRCSGLFLLNTSLETAGESIGIHEKIVSVIQDDICKALLVNSTTDDMIIFSLTLRVVFNLFQSVKRHLKVQLEVFFNSIHLKMAGAYEDSKEPLVVQKSELALESIVDFCNEPSLILELYTNYDCDVHFNNLFEALTRFLCKHAFPLNQNLIRLNELCLEGLLAIIASISFRCNKITPETQPQVTNRAQRALKEKYRKSAEVFNNDPKDFVSKLQDLDFLPRNADAHIVAKFLMDNPAVDNTLLGEYLAKKKDFNSAVRDEFMRLFDYTNLGIELALKHALTRFKLPGEAQEIDRIMESFSKAYYSPDSIFANDGAVFILAFSIIMLHTDLHNQNLKVKMSEDAYIRNLRGQNGGSDFPKEMLSKIYHNIASESFQVLDPIHSVEDEELLNPERANNKWLKIIKRTQLTGNYSMLNEHLLQPAGENEKDMFELIWDSGLLGTLTNALDCADSQSAASQLKKLFVKSAKVCAYFDLSDNIYKLLNALCSCFLRSTESIVGFYSSRKAQCVLDAIVKASMVSKEHLRAIWTHIVNCLLRLHHLKLLPQDLVELEDFVDSEGRILPMALQEPDKGAMLRHFHWAGQPSTPSVRSEEEREEAGGIWSAFTKYIGIPQQTVKSNEEVLAEMKMELKLRVADSKLHILFLNTKLLPPESLFYLIRTLIQRCKDSNDEVNAVLCKELMINSVIINAPRITHNIWTAVLDLLEDKIKAPAQRWGSERALVGFLRICIRHHVEFIEFRSALVRVLDYMAALTPNDLSRHAERLLAGLQILMNGGECGFLVTGDCWNLLITILNTSCKVERALPSGLELISLIVKEICNSDTVELNNYEELLDLIVIYIRQGNDTTGKTQLGLRLIQNLHKNIFKKHSDEAVLYFWKKILVVVGRLCQENKNYIRTQAYSLLQDMVLTSGTHPELQHWHIWKDCFEKVLFPLVIEPFIIPRETINSLSETDAARLKDDFESSREKAMWLICQTLMSKLELISLSQEFSTFWIRLIKLMGQALRTKSRQDINEKSFELVKNFLLVIKSENALNEELWQATWDIFALDELKNEICNDTEEKERT